MGIKRPKIFSKKIDATTNQEIIVKENYGELILTDFEIWNLGESDIEIKINNSDENILLESMEGFSMGNDETFSCIIVTGGTIKFSGKY